MTVETHSVEPALFSSSHGAALFAYRYSSQQYGRSAMSRLMAGPTGTGKGLAGLDGAAQAGMIRNLISRLGPLHEAIIIARFSPRESICTCGRPCCGGKTSNSEWMAAVRLIGDLSVVATPCVVSHARLRCGIVAKHFGLAVSIGELADQCQVHRNTASKHAAMILTWLRGKSARGTIPAITGEEGKATLALNEVLEEAGLICSA